MSNTAITTEVLRGRQPFLALADEWEALCDTAERPSPYLRHGFIRAGFALGNGDPGALRTILVREGGELMMATALVLGFRGLVPVVRWPSPGIPRLDDLVWRRSPRTAEHASALLAALRRRLVVPRLLRTPQLRAGSPLLGAMEGLGLTRRSRQVSTNYVLRLSDYSGYSGYLHSLGSNLRLDHGRRLRRIADAGRFELIREHSAEALDWLVDNKLEWLDRTGKTALWLSNGYARRFFHAALLGPGAQPWSVWSIVIDGARIAAALSLDERDAWSTYMIAQNPAMNRLAPGRTLNLLIVERAYAAGISRVEFGVTNPDWKERLGALPEAVLSEKIRLR